MARIARFLALILALAPTLAFAQDWRKLNAEQIRAALEGRRLIYDGGAWQEFNPSGRTLYNAGRDSWGYWRTDGDRYCSQWPPSDLWACYDLFAAPDGAALRFVGRAQDVTQGRYAD